jgi:hypothetical protein
LLEENRHYFRRLNFDSGETQAICLIAGHTNHARQASQVACMFGFAQNCAQMNASSPFPPAFSKTSSNEDRNNYMRYWLALR